MTTEKLIFERGAPGRRAATLPTLDVPDQPLDSLLPCFKDRLGTPRVSLLMHHAIVFGPEAAPQVFASVPSCQHPRHDCDYGDQNDRDDYPCLRRHTTRRQATPSRHP